MKTQKKPVTPERRKKLEESRQRMQEVIADFQMNPSELEKHLGITHGLISNILLMRNAMYHTVAKAVKDKRPEYSYEWVMYGTGTKMKPVEETPIKTDPVEKTESSQSEFIIELLKDKVKSLEEKVEERDKTIAKLRRLGGSGTIPKPIPETILSKKNG